MVGPEELMDKQAVKPTRGPRPVGPYSPAIVSGDLVFVSGQGPMNPDSGQLEKSDVGSEMKLVMENLRILLEAAGCTLDSIVKTTVYLADMDDFAKMNELYRTYFKEPYPARTTIQAARLPMGIKIEIEAIARK
jgi:2-iminobutanoate/2-iminopropanoate deaminase